MLSGFSSGGFLALNFFTMFSVNIHSLGLFASAGPCANRGDFCYDEAGETMQYPVDGFADTPVYIYSGTMDKIVPNKNVSETAEWLEGHGLNVERAFIDDFVHLMPNSLPPGKPFTKPRSCGIYPEGDQLKTANCGFNLAKGAL